jgi:HEAT repeat protein
MRSELDLNLARALNPIGGDADQQERQTAIGYLLAHADEIYPLLLSNLEANPKALDAPAIIELLGRFGRPEGIPVLERILLGGGEFTAREAGVALGRSPQPESLHILIAALSSDDPEVAIGAAGGLLARGDTEGCAALRKLIDRTSDSVRYHFLQALGILGCLDDADWKKWELDPDPAIRALITRVRRPRIR